MPKFTMEIDEPVMIEVTYDIERGQPLTRDQPYIPNDVEITGVRIVNWMKVMESREVVMGAFDHMSKILNA